MSSNPVGVSRSSWLNYSECDVNVWMQLLCFYLMCCNTLNSHPVLHEQLRRCNTLSSVECGVRCAARSNIRVVNVIPEFVSFQVQSCHFSPRWRKGHTSRQTGWTQPALLSWNHCPRDRMSTHSFTHGEITLHRCIKTLEFWHLWIEFVLKHEIEWKCSLILLFLFCFVKFCCVVEVKNTHVCHSSFIWNFQSTGGMVDNEPNHCEAHERESLFQNLHNSVLKWRVFCTYWYII